jgi:hypothetical protein
MNKEFILNSLGELISEEITKNKDYEFALVVFDNQKKGRNIWYTGNIQPDMLIINLATTLVHCKKPKFI